MDQNQEPVNQENSAPPTPPPSPEPVHQPEQIHKPKKWVWITLLILFLGFSYVYDQMTSEDGSLQPESDRTTNPAYDDAPTATNDSYTKQPATQPTRTVTDETAFQLVADSAGTCTVMRPSDWTKPVPAPGNQGADLSSPDKSMYAGNPYWSINTGIAPYAYAYQPPMNNPDLYSADPATAALAWGNVILSQLGGDGGLSYSGEISETIGEYQLRSVASSTHKGVIFYHNSGFQTGDGYTYVLPTRYALTRSDLWDSKGLMVARVAASLSCTATYVPRSSSGPDFGSSSSSSGKDENGSDAGYNPQLGTEEVHDPTTGENYVVDPSQNWSETGPNGPGYYAPKSGGNDYVQLEPGRSD